ncbi:hypothetical protein J6E39_01930 [bacterium]|nr:hypothetical protein [bacterium]
MIINSNVPQTFQSSRHTSPEKTSDKIKAGIGAIAGTVIPLAAIMKSRKIKNPFKMEYGLQDMLILSATSVSAGVCAGMIGEDKATRKNKLKEGVFQFLNASIPTWIVGGVLKLPESSSKFNNPTTKVLSVFGGLIVGMFGAAKISNLIFDPKDIHPDRKLTFKDCLANADDVIGALVLARIPLIDKLHAEKILPAIYAYCGYRAGKSK